MFKIALLSYCLIVLLLDAGNQQYSYKQYSYFERVGKKYVWQIGSLEGVNLICFFIKK